jgi:hypothetical protein
MHIAAPLTCRRTIFTFAPSPEQAGVVQDQSVCRAIYHNETPPLMGSLQRLPYTLLVAMAFAVASPAASQNLTQRVDPGAPMTRAMVTVSGDSADRLRLGVLDGSAALAGFLTAFLSVQTGLYTALLWALGGAAYGLITGWIIALAQMGTRRP